jgi:hypothetical protein
VGASKLNGRFLEEEVKEKSLASEDVRASITARALILKVFLSLQIKFKNRMKLSFPAGFGSASPLGPRQAFSPLNKCNVTALRDNSANAGVKYL